jgi:hypothetical protein
MLEEIPASHKNVLDNFKEKDLYALEKASFHPFDGIEVWDFSDAIELKYGFLSFFAMRSILHTKILGKKIEVKNFNNLLKLQLYNLGYSEIYSKFFQGAFFPSLVGKNSNKKEPPSLAFLQKTEKNTSFLFYKEDRKKFSLSGGGIYLDKAPRVYDVVEEMFQTFSLSQKNGTFFLRTSRNSYFYPLDPQNRSRIFYVQERNPIEVPFHFVYIQSEL